MTRRLLEKLGVDYAEGSVHHVTFLAAANRINTRLAGKNEEASRL